MAKIRFGYSDDFTAKNNKVGINTTEPQTNLDVVGVVKGQDIKVTGVSSFTAYEGFLRANHQIAENTTLTFDQGPVSSLSGEIIVGSGVTVTIDNLPDGEYGPELIINGTFDSNTTGWTANNAVLTSTSNQLKVDDTANAGSWSSASQEIKTEPGAKYRWEVTVGSTTDGSFIGYNAGKYTAGNAPTEFFGEFSGGQTTAIEFIAPEKITTIVLITNNDGVSYYDNVSLKKINVAEEPRAGGSEIECLKVYNTFTPPSGGTNERPYAPKPGELYYNYDLKTIEFHDGNGWRQVDNTNRSGRAVFSGGATPGDVNTIDYFQIHTLGNAMDFGDATITESRKSGCASATRGLSGGSDDTGNHEVIDYVTIASTGNAIDFGNLYNGRGASAGMSSSTRGLWAGGRSPSTSQDTIDYVEIATLGNALDFGDITQSKQWLAGCSSSTRGIIAGGEDPAYGTPNRTSQIEFITMASKGDAILFGELTAMTGNPGGCSNSTRGVFGGGEPQTYSKIDMITIASTGNAIHFGDLTYGRFVVNGVGSQTRATFIGGHSNKNTIDYINMSTGGDAQDFGDLTVGRWSGASFSDSHGGLGGF
tara:strand:+ start:1173 stop:2945 length:1773 start_codon:yes stop_codon:yes gene_type:complete